METTIFVLSFLRASITEAPRKFSVRTIRTAEAPGQCRSGQHRRLPSAASYLGFWHQIVIGNPLVGSCGEAKATSLRIFPHSTPCMQLSPHTAFHRKMNPNSFLDSFSTWGRPSTDLLFLLHWYHAPTFTGIKCSYTVKFRFHTQRLATALFYTFPAFHVPTILS